MLLPYTTLYASHVQLAILNVYFERDNNCVEFIFFRCIIAGGFTISSISLITLNLHIRMSPRSCASPNLERVSSAIDVELELRTKLQIYKYISCCSINFRIPLFDSSKLRHLTTRKGSYCVLCRIWLGSLFRQESFQVATGMWLMARQFSKSTWIVAECAAMVTTTWLITHVNFVLYRVDSRCVGGTTPGVAKGASAPRGIAVTFIMHLFVKRAIIKRRTTTWMAV